MRSAIFSAMFTALVIAAVTLSVHGSIRADAATQPAATQPVVVKWEEAARHVGETVTITGAVKGTHVTSGGKALILNVGLDYPDTKRFTVMITMDEKNPAKEQDYADKTVTVTGKVELYRNVPEIKVAKASDVMIEKHD